MNDYELIKREITTALYLVRKSHKLTWRELVLATVTVLSAIVEKHVKG